MRTEIDWGLNKCEEMELMEYIEQATGPRGRKLRCARQQWRRFIYILKLIRRCYREFKNSSSSASPVTASPEDAEAPMAVTPTNEELSNISLCAQKLWDLDDNRLDPEVHYGINIQQGKRPFVQDDVAEERLFRGVSRSIWERPSYAAFYALLDNYERETGTTEQMTRKERDESRVFIDEAVKSQPMRYVHNYLVAKNLASPNVTEFKKMLFDLWFSFYRRNTHQDSSAFEHVFVGESDDGQIKGFHNWIQFFIEESHGRVDYKGFVLPRRRGMPEPDANERLLSLQLGWDGEVKFISSFFIGTSPEFELAIYTLYFLAGRETNRVSLLNYELEIKCYRIHGNRIGSTFVTIEFEH